MEVTAATDLSLTPISVLTKDVDAFLERVCSDLLQGKINTPNRLGCGSYCGLEYQPSLQCNK